MGTDIHTYVEYRAKRGPRRRSWSSFGRGFSLDRNYTLFACLAGVRGPQPAGLVPPRGVPSDPDYAAEYDYMLLGVPSEADTPGLTNSEGNFRDTADALMYACLVNPGADTPRMALLDELQTRYGEPPAAGRARHGRFGTCTLEEANSYAATEGTVVRRTAGSELVMVENPDWHTPSWLTPDEWQAALAAAGMTDRTAPDYHAVLAAMRALEASGHAVRVVFWFDN